jgi:hypothetical protein
MKRHLLQAMNTETLPHSKNVKLSPCMTWRQMRKWKYAPKHFNLGTS